MSYSVAQEEAADPRRLAGADCYYRGGRALNLHLTEITRE
jgi:hypothetical protein